jgi:3-phenylpropionate/trans-cinnamate dioxygenase ferredoxin subunit
MGVVDAAVEGAPDSGWVDVGSLAELRGGRLTVRIGDQRVLVVKTRRLVLAVEDECPHLGRSLSDGRVSGRAIRCAAHGLRWDLPTGNSRSGACRRKLRTVPVRVDGDRILLAWPLPAPEAGWITASAQERQDCQHDRPTDPAVAP